MNCGSELGYTLSTNGCTCDQGSYRGFVGFCPFSHLRGGEISRFMVIVHWPLAPTV